ncbi:TonB-dependent receptor [Echinimonas agarilytica]|uniref:TonB-dependent receptor n=1 Tax=Echinimonas agarilytica TaxID=1215918 RepID=A0AA41W4W7_9GAMM|nr:TonB-dependent receptor [Echinimonas agarilytica]MCM2678512.1 TonB-dependent receptor [Echinimonas agarilytica]
MHFKLSKVALSVVSATTMAITFAAHAQDENTPADPQSDVEVIEVTGIQQSLSAAASFKRSDSRIVDVIVAEDIGKLPDNNIAETLQRITGVSINRDMGVGSDVSIRGLPQNRVELNGRSTLGDGRNGVDFQDFPSDFLSGIEVVKSPTPKMIEGALGGTINLKTQRPLDLKETLASVSVKGEYTENAEDWGPILFATYGDKWELSSGGTIGMIASVSYLDRKLTQHESRVGFKVEPLNVNQADIDSGKVDADRNYIIPHEYTYFPEVDERERSAANIALQWMPESEDGNVYLEAAFTKREGNNQAFSPLSIAHSPFSTDAERNADYSIDGKGQLNSYYDSDVLFINRTESEFRETDSMTLALGTEWSFEDQWLVTAEVSHATSDSFEPYYDMRFYAIDPEGEALAPEDNNYWQGGVSYYSNNDHVPSVVLEDPNTFTNQDNWALRRYDVRDNHIDNEETAGRLDFSYYEPVSGFDMLTAVDFGVRYTERDYEKKQYNLKLDNLHKSLIDYGPDGLPDTDDDEYITITMPEFPAGTIKEYDFDAFPDDSAQFDLDRFVMFDNNILQNQTRTGEIIGSLLQGTNMETDGKLVFNTDEYATVGEDTLAAYIQLNFDTDIAGMPFKTVFGGRYVATDIEVEAYAEDVNGNIVLVKETSDYSDFLPSLNASLEVVDDTIVRFAAAKVMRRADFEELSPGYIVNADSTEATRGNPGLEPYRATQYDISVEYYWGDSNMVSAAIFYKDVESFLTTATECWDNPEYVAVSNEVNRGDMCFLDGRGGAPDASTPLTDIGLTTTFDTNGDSGKVEGVELAYQQVFDMGVGASLNYTYADSEDPNGSPLLDISKDTVNAAIFYEKHGFTTRLAYTYRSRFLEDDNEGRMKRIGREMCVNASCVDANGDSYTDPTARESYRESMKQLDWSGSYDFNKNLRVQADIVNITEEPTRDAAFNGSVYQIRQADRRFTVGMRYKF